MSLHPKLFIVKESRAGERRVSLIPEDVEKLVSTGGFRVFIEDNAGVGAGYNNSAYEAVGAEIRKISQNSVESYRANFNDIDIIVRAKRPDRAREKLESWTIKPNTKMIGSLDLLEKDSGHVKEYQQAGIDYYSFDQFIFPTGSPMDALKKMSTFAGRLSVEDAIKKADRVVKKAVIVGHGEAGQGAYAECQRRNLICTIITSDKHKAANIKMQGGVAIYLSRETPLSVQQESVNNLIKDVDIVIATASSKGVVAPILIPTKTLLAMKPGAVIVDLSVTEGGNVEGSKHDATLILGNKVCVTNTSGYPKQIPVEASKEWSKVSYYFLNLLVETPELLKRRQ